jgi:hypothetical protein
MKLFEDHHGERVLIQCGSKELRIDGFLMGLYEGCLILASAPDGKGQHKYIPWPNPNIVSIEFVNKK